MKCFALQWSWKTINHPVCLFESTCFTGGLGGLGGLGTRPLTTTTSGASTLAGKCHASTSGGGK